MCGIAGIISAEGPVPPALGQRMCAGLAHRGPDSQGCFAEDGVFLGVTRLAVIDVPGGDQPLRNEDGSLILVCNGEIYNHDELRRKLIASGHTFATRSDSEVVLHLYEELGASCVDHLRGMFAFALWDRRRRRLMLARDRVGKKPLFYAAHGANLWFASEPRAILTDRRVPRDVDPRAIDLYLHYQVVPSPLSAFAAIRKLPPAHVLTFSRGRASTRRYWKLSYRNRLAGLSGPDACARIREAVLEATRLRLRSDVPVGALLSGGIDSSAVVAAMAMQSSRPVKTFSIGFDVSSFDETASAREVAARYATDHHELVLDASALGHLPRLVWHYGEPYADSSALATFALAELARREVTVVLNGDGGDESFGGYARHVRPLPTAPLHRHYAERRAHQYFDEPERIALLTPEFRQGLGDHDWRGVVEDPYFASDAEDPVERTIDVDVQTYLAEDLLVKMDIATMAHSLEARSPLCDQRVMELAAALPMELKVRGTHTKALFKQAVRDWLPKSILNRPKMGFMIPMAEWLRGSLATEILLDPATLSRGILRPARVHQLTAEHAAGRGGHEYRIWTLLMLELWFRTYVDSESGDRPVTLPSA